MPVECNILGYVKESTAKDYGFTNHGSYYGIPLYISTDPDFAVVAIKWTPLEYIMPVLHKVDWFFRRLLMADYRRDYLFHIGRKIQ